MNRRSGQEQSKHRKQRNLKFIGILGNERKSRDCESNRVEQGKARVQLDEVVGACAAVLPGVAVVAEPDTGVAAAEGEALVCTAIILGSAALPTICSENVSRD